MKRKARASTVRSLAFRFSILLAAFIVAFSVSIIFLLRFRIRNRQSRELVDAAGALYAAIQPAGEQRDYDFDDATNAELPYYITYTIYGYGGRVFSTNDPFMPLLPVTEKRARRYSEENYFSDGDLNILYYAISVGDEPATAEDPDGNFVIETALNIDTDESILLLLGLPKIMLAALPPLLLLSYFAAFLIAKRVMRSVRDMTETAMRISSANLDSRLPVTNRGDEFDTLALTLNDLLSRLQRDFKREKQFTSDVSHELRTPLAVILGHANLIKRWGKNDAAQLEKSLDSLIGEANSMVDIINNLLVISRMESGRTKINKSEIDVASLFSRVAENTRSWAQGVTFETRVGEPFVFADESLLYEACTIVVSNSVKFAGEKAHILLSSERAGDFVKIQIADDGPGFAPDVLPHVFERFYRGDEAHTRSAGGSGLGLAIVKSIMLACGGDVTAANGKNGGAVMTLRTSPIP